MMTGIDRIKDLVKQLNVYRDHYYNQSMSVVSDFEYDQLFDELQTLEKDVGFVMSNSPTQNVGYEVKSELNKVRHRHPMLSLDKTKKIDDLVKFVGHRDYLLMCKMDGLTCSLTYRNGELVAAETRGDGEVGEDVLHNAKVITNIPKKIKCKNELVVDGEVIILYDDFHSINASLSCDQQYKHPRNLASGSIRQLNSQIAEQRKLKFIAWKCVEGLEENSFYERLGGLQDLGFDVVPMIKTNDTEHLEILINNLKEIAQRLGIPIDGAVVSYDNVEYGDSLGSTGHHIRSQIAFKFYDELYETKLQRIDWTMGKTGVLTPTAVFDPVEIDGSSVSRASLHNISILQSLGLTNHCTVYVYKANQIIPQIDYVEEDGEGKIQIPEKCPICGSVARIHADNGTARLECSNNQCRGRLLGMLTGFASKKGVNIDGMSEATLEAFIDKGWINCFGDIYRLHLHKNEIIKLDGFGEKSYAKLIKAIDDSRKVKLSNFIAAQGIDGLGTSSGKVIAKFFNNDYVAFSNALNNDFDFSQLEGVGEITNKSIHDWWEEHMVEVFLLAEEFEFESIANQKMNASHSLIGKILCVTGKLESCTRDDIGKKLAEFGASLSGSVSKNTSYLITNETSESTKYKKALELGVPIITEQEFLDMMRGVE